MTETSWMDHPSMKNLDPRKKEIILDLIKETNGKPLNKSLPSLLSAQSRLKALGLSFTPEETTTIMAILTQGLSPQDMAKVNAMRKMMDK